MFRIMPSNCLCELRCCDRCGGADEYPACTEVPEFGVWGVATRDAHNSLSKYHHTFQGIDTAAVTSYLGVTLSRIAAGTSSKAV